MIDTNSAKSPESVTVGQSIGQVVHDLMTLVELQARLFRSDAREVTERVARPLIVFLAGSLLFLATIPVALMAIALGLIAAGLPQAAAYAIVAVVSMGAAIGMAAWAWKRFRAMPAAFSRSHEELSQNIAWIKHVIGNVESKSKKSHGNGRTSLPY